MQRAPIGFVIQLLFMAVVLLLGLLFLREPRLERSEEFFLRWLLKNSEPHSKAASLTVVDIGHDNSMERQPAGEGDENSPRSGANVVSPMEFALFLQSTLEFQPTVVAFENILKWRETEKDQEQVFIDQAMRVPKLLLAAELTTNPDPDAAGPDIPGFTQVTGRRGDLVEFSILDGRQYRSREACYRIGFGGGHFESDASCPERSDESRSSAPLSPCQSRCPRPVRPGPYN